MTINIKQIFNNFEFFNVQSYKNLSVIGIKSSKSFKNMDILPLTKGLDMGIVEINEMDNPTVDTLKVTNKAITPLLILDGEELIGAKQNRIVNDTYIIPAKTTMNIKVSCTEEGRWSYKSKHFSHSKHIAESNVRRAKAEDVSHSLKVKRKRSSNQSRVWNTISHVNNKLNVKSDTDALRDMYIFNKHKINEYLSHFPIQDDMIGSIIIINNEVVGIELLFNKSLYKNNHEKLIESYIPDAIIKLPLYKKSCEIKDISYEFINEIFHSKFDKYDSDGLGCDYRMNSKDIVGSATLLNDKPVNASFLRKLKS